MCPGPPELNKDTTCWRAMYRYRLSHSKSLLQIKEGGELGNGQRWEVALASKFNVKVCHICLGDGSNNAAFFKNLTREVTEGPVD